MARDPSDATPSILQQIQETLADHGRRWGGLEHRLDGVDRRLDGLDHLMQEVSGRVGEIRTGMMTALGYLTHADNRHNELQRAIDDLNRRVSRLEEKV